METFKADGKYFNIYDTLSCGQMFRYKVYKKGYLCYSKNHACYLHNDGDSVIIETDYPDYFYNYFDLSRNYGEIVEKAKSFGIDYLTEAAEYGKGIRILNQDAEETIFSFMVSQNNNIPRIKGIIEKLCESAGEKFVFDNETHFAFPSLIKLKEKDETFFFALGLGYRSGYFTATASDINDEIISSLKTMDRNSLKEELKKFKGIGEKVADCISLFGFHKVDSFPVDVWIDKVYRENFGGKETDRKKISQIFTDKFGEYSGYIQQYLFYYKREK